MILMLAMAEEIIEGRWCGMEINSLASQKKEAIRSEASQMLFA